MLADVTISLWLMMMSTWLIWSSDLIPGPDGFVRRFPKQHRPGSTTGPRGSSCLIVDIRRHERSLIKQQRRESYVEGKDGIESWFARYFSKVSEDCGELGIDAFSIYSVEFGGSTTLGNARGLGSSNSKCRFVDKHVKQDASWHSRLFRIVKYCSSSSSDRI
jgi:hypothetical protein